MDRALYGRQVYKSPTANRQSRYAELLMKQGTETNPVGSPLEAIARVGTAGIGGYLANQAEETEKQYNTERQALLAKALSGDPTQAANILLSDPKTADLGSQLAVGQMEFNRNRAAKKEDAAEERDFRKEMYGMERQGRMEDMYASQNFQREMARINQAFQSGQLSQQQAFQMAENAKNREADAAKQAAAAALSKVPQGYQINPEGGVQPIPGSPQATEAADVAKSKAESVVSVDRMIRSIDELSNHPGLEGTVGFSVGQRFIPGTDAASFDARLETLKSQAFLPMVAQLKGMGQLSDAEGKKLTAAIGALDNRMSEKEFRASLQEIKSDLESARKRMGAPEQPTVSRPAVPANGMPALPNGFRLVP